MGFVPNESAGILGEMLRYSILVIGGLGSVLPKNSAALEKLWFTRLPDSSSSASRRVLFGIGCDPPRAETSGGCRVGAGVSPDAPHGPVRDQFSHTVRQ